MRRGLADTRLPTGRLRTWTIWNVLELVVGLAIIFGQAMLVSFGFLVGWLIGKAAIGQ